MLTFQGKVRLISDLHLQPSHAAVNQRFARFLVECAESKVEALFILGDLFEYWIGDDAACEPFNTWVCTRLNALAGAGTKLYFMHGNRDFLVGNELARRCSFALLSDGTKISAGGVTTMLMHGDTLCTDDTEYQKFRQLVRTPQWQTAFLARPLDERLAEVARLREGSRLAMQAKSPEIMDANASAIVDVLRNSDCARLIHGHTHRPSHDFYQLQGHKIERWVLSDWTETRGDALEITSHGVTRIDQLS